MAIEIYPRKQASRPHTSVTTDSSAIGGSTSSSDKVLMLVGSAKGGKPNEVYKVRNYQQAKSIFRSGDLLDAIELAWNPSADGSVSAGDILAMRVENATQATLEVGGLKVTSAIYGLEANDIQVSLSDNELTNTKRITLAFINDKVLKTFDNLGSIFSIKYKGTEALATVDITKDTITGLADKLTLSVGTGEGATTVVKEYKLGSGVYEDTYTLISDINNLPDFEATFFPIGDKNIPTSDFDELKSQPIKDTTFYIKALAGDIKKQLASNGYIDIEIDPKKELVNFSLTNLSGGSDGVVPESWADKFAKFANEGGFYLVPLTSKPAVHAEALAFAKDRSDGGELIRVIAGVNKNESIQDKITRAGHLRNERIVLVGFSGKRTMDDGRLLSVPGYLQAAQVGGYVSGLPIGESITFKSYAIDSLDEILTGDQLDQLNENGVMCLEFVRNRVNTMFRIVQDTTTYNDATDPVRHELAIGEQKDFLVSELKIKLDNQFIGQKTTELSASLIKSFVQTFLDQKKRDDEIQGYPPEDVQVVIQGDRAFISFTLYPTRSLNLITANIVYASQVLTA